MRPFFALVLLLLPAAAHADTVAAALRDSRWADAAALEADAADPVARKLVLYFRLLTPAAAHPAEIAAFLADNPTWPNGALLTRRLAEALAVEPDSRIVLDICNHQSLQDVPSLLRCADAQAEIGSIPSAAQAARQAWISGITDPAQEQGFLHQWGPAFTASDQWRRFDRLAWSDSPAIGGPAWRQIARLDPSLRKLAEARLALRRDVPTAMNAASEIAAGFAADPASMLECARWMRRASRDEDAQKLWLTQGAAAEHAAPPERRPAFWAERELLARRRLRAADATGAYALVQDASDLAPEQQIDAAFLAGFIALRWLHDTASAARHFQALAGLSPAAITQARAHYWLGRTAQDAAQAASNPTGARLAYAAAAAWPTTFYGQLAARALGDHNALEADAQLAARIRAVHDPAWTPDRALDFLGNENARAVALLTAWGEPRRARAFLLRLDELAHDAVDRSLAAHMAQSLGQPDLAVAIARRAGRDGLMLAETGWPAPVSPPSGAVEPALTLGLIRQESNFNAEAASPAGARGLMQLMPATAQEVAHRLGEPALPPGVLVSDPAYNMRLGTTYLAGLLDQFGGAVPYAVAGYNAGPNRVGEWLAANGDPAQGGPAQRGGDMVDWIELIPFAETRNYVQRVIENVVVYRAQAGLVLPHPLARWLG